MQQPQQHGGTFHNIKEKIKHPLRHDTDTNTTFASHEQKKLQEGEPLLQWVLILKQFMTHSWPIVMLLISQQPQAQLVCHNLQHITLMCQEKVNIKESSKC